METVILFHWGLKSIDTTTLLFFFFLLTFLLIKLSFLWPISVISHWKTLTTISHLPVCYSSLRKHHSTWIQVSVFSVSTLGISHNQEPDFTRHSPQISSHHCPGILLYFSDNQTLLLSRFIFLVHSLQTPHCQVIISLMMSVPSSDDDLLMRGTQKPLGSITSFFTIKSTDLYIYACHHIVSWVVENGPSLQTITRSYPQLLYLDSCPLTEQLSLSSQKKILHFDL